MNRTHVGSSGRRLRGALAVIAALALSGAGADLARAQEADGATQTLAPAGAAGAAVPSAQFAPTDQPSIVVTGAGEASAPAETAHIQLFVGRGFDAAMGMGVAVAGGSAVVEEGTPEAGLQPAEPPAGAEPRVEPATVEMAPPPRLTEEDLAPIVEAMVAAQVDRDAIEVYVYPSSGDFGPGGGGVGRINATLEGPTRDAVEAVLGAADEATTEAALSFFNVGVEYRIADCTALRREARGEAIADARDQATEMADLLGVALGELLQAYDYGTAFGPAQATDDPGCSSADPFGGSFGFGPGIEVTIPSYDPTVPLEAEVYAAITMTFAVGDAAP